MATSEYTSSDAPFLGGTPYSWQFCFLLKFLNICHLEYADILYKHACSPESVVIIDSGGSPGKKAHQDSTVVAWRSPIRDFGAAEVHCIISVCEV